MPLSLSVSLSIFLFFESSCLIRWLFFLFVVVVAAVAYIKLKRPLRFAHCKPHLYTFTHTTAKLKYANKNAVLFLMLSFIYHLKWNCLHIFAFRKDPICDTVPSQIIYFILNDIEQLIWNNFQNWYQFFNLLFVVVDQFGSDGRATNGLLGGSAA